MAGKEIVTTAMKNEERRPTVALGYREVPGIGTDRDVIEQLHANLAQLEDLSARLRFVMSEVRYHLPKP